MYTRTGKWIIRTSEAPYPIRYEVVHDGAPDSGDHRAALARSLKEAYDFIQETGE